MKSADSLKRINLKEELDELKEKLDKLKCRRSDIADKVNLLEEEYSCCLGEYILNSNKIKNVSLTARSYINNQTFKICRTTLTNKNFINFLEPFVPDSFAVTINKHIELMFFKSADIVRITQYDLEAFSIFVEENELKIVGYSQDCDIEEKTEQLKKLKEKKQSFIDSIERAKRGKEWFEGDI